MNINLKNFGLLEVIVIMSLIYVVGMLIWTASTRPAVEAKANYNQLTQLEDIIVNQYPYPDKDDLFIDINNTGGKY